MYHIAVVEDDPADAQLLEHAINRFSAENKAELALTLFTSIETFLAPKGEVYDIVFFDIELPGTNGMVGARRFRDKNPEAIIFFTTNLRQYVLKGYEVEAMDYMLKPVRYENLVVKLKRAIHKLEISSYKTVLVHTRNEVFKLRSIDLIFVEVREHSLTYHTREGVYDSSGNLSELEEVLAPHGFYRCKSCYLVNMRMIWRIEDLTVYLRGTGETLQISRRKKQEFLDAFTKFCGR